MCTFNLDYTSDQEDVRPQEREKGASLIFRLWVLHVPLATEMFALSPAHLGRLTM